MHRSIVQSRQVQVALAGVTLSLVVFAAQLADALSPAPLPQPAGTRPSQAGAVQEGQRTPNHLIEGAIAAAPFTPSREVASTPQAATPGRSPQVQDVELAGTVVGDDSFALVSVGGGAARVVRVGAMIGGYRLRSIGQGRAVLTRVSDGERLELAVPRSK